MTTGERPLRILHLTAGSDAGGVSRYLVDLCAVMRRAGHEVAIAGQRGVWHDWFATAPWPWIQVPLKGNVLALRKAARVLRQYLAEHPVDVLHAHYRRAALVGRWVQNGQRRPPLLVTVHLSHIPLNWPWRWLSEFGDHTHVPSEMARRWAIEQARVAPCNITLIPHGVDPARFPYATDPQRSAARQVLGLPGDAVIAAYVGRFDEPKNEGWLLDLAASPQCPREVIFILAGEGPNEPALRQRIEREGLRQRVRLLGRRDPLEVYRAADALLLPSAREGFSLACAEAMSVGVPVLRTRTAGAWELIVEGVTGQSVQIERDAFIAAAARFLRDRGELRRMGRAAAEHVGRHFTAAQQVERTIDLYQRLAGK